jgi:hypothetical protein
MALVVCVPSVCVDFVNADGLALPLPNPTPGMAAFVGQDAVYTRHFRVRITAGDINSKPPLSVRGVLFVQRQHSIEV